jgi:hypothetical protein
MSGWFSSVEIALVDTTPLAKGSSFIKSPKLSNSDHISAGLLTILANGGRLWMIRIDRYEQCERAISHRKRKPCMRIYEKGHGCSSSAS